MVINTPRPAHLSFLLGAGAGPAAEQVVVVVVVRVPPAGCSCNPWGPGVMLTMGWLCHPAAWGKSWGDCCVFGEGGQE